MPFQFINNDNLSDNATRKQIRRHAALGINKGRKVSRMPRKEVLTDTTTEFRVPLIMGGTSAERSERNDEIERPIDDGLFLPDLLPGEPKGLVKKVISFMCAIRLSPELDDGLDYGGLGAPACVQYMLVDAGCFHSTMATALVCLDNLVGRSESKLQALRHASRTVRLVNQKLSKSAITDFTIAAVISMAQYEHHQNQFQQGSAHVQGLWHISQLRGGISNLTGSPSGLGQKMLRVDLEYSLQLGTPTSFTLEEAEIGCKPISRFPSMCLQSDVSILPLALARNPARALPANYRDLFVDVLFLASLLNNAILGNARKIDAIELHQDIILLGYRLVNLRPLGLPRGISWLQNKVHLGLAAFLVTFLRGWDGRLAQNDLLAELLISAARQPVGADQDGRETLLWLLFIGAAASNLCKHPVWISRAKCTLQSLQIICWQDAKALLAEFPWVDAVHDSAGQALWQEVHSCG